MPIVPPPAADGYGPLGTPNAGRAERIARRERADLARNLAACAHLDSETELCRLQQEVRRLRAELPARVNAEVVRVLADQLPEALDSLFTRREVSRNGHAAQAPGR